MYAAHEVTEHLNASEVDVSNVLGDNITLWADSYFPGFQKHKTFEITV